MLLSFLLLAAGLAGDVPAKPAGATRFATFNASLNREAQGELVRDLSTPDNPQARNVAEIIQRVAPDVLLINEFDHDPEGRGVALFQKNYLEKSQNGAAALEYPYHYTAEVNTGVASGLDLDRDGEVVRDPGGRGYGNDALGFGQFPGQYGMVIFSKFPIDREQVRRFDRVLWKDMPGALVPRDADGQPWYSKPALDVFRLSSKGHWDVPIRVGDRTIHVLASHPTPPAFDGPEDRNGKRNHDEVRLWADYLTGGDKAAYLKAADSPPTFVLMGDLNSDPHDGGSVPGTMDALLKHPKIEEERIPRSQGAAEAARLQGNANQHHRGDPGQDTADFSEAVGNLRVDYVLPSRDLQIVNSGVFWPESSDPLARLVRMKPKVASSDHRLVYVDIE